MPNAKDDGTPKLVIETQSLFGQQKVEKVEVDSNRLDPIQTAKQRLITSLIHPYLIDALGDAACWFCGTAFLVSILLHTSFLVYFQVPFILCLITVVIGAFFALIRIPELTGAIVFRVFLVIGGLIMGGSV
jgi:hypothetical protein